MTPRIRRPILTQLLGIAFVAALPGCKAFVADRAIVNGGRPVENPVTPVATIPLHPTETTLYWAGGDGRGADGESGRSSRLGGWGLDRQSGSNMAVIYYGHKEKSERPRKAPFLVLSKTIRHGGREAAEWSFDEPPPEKMTYRLTIRNIGSADYKGRLELVDQFPSDVRFLGVRSVHEHKMIWLPYLGSVPAAYESRKWHAEPAGPATGARFRWTCDDADIEKGHWLTIDLDFEPPAWRGFEQK